VQDSALKLIFSLPGLYAAFSAPKYHCRMLKETLKEYRCGCGKLLFKGSLFSGTVEIKCRHCRDIASFLGEFEHPKIKKRLNTVVN
jgi:phage FluMu protein Com